MSRSERAKGKAGEAEVRALLLSHGLNAQPLGGRLDQSDQLVGRIAGRWLSVEVKRQETARPWAWWEQAQQQAGAALPVVAFRRSRSRWLALLELEDLAALLTDLEVCQAELTRLRARGADLT